MLLQTRRVSKAVGGDPLGPHDGHGDEASGMRERICVRDCRTRITGSLDGLINSPAVDWEDSSDHGKPTTALHPGGFQVLNVAATTGIRYQLHALATYRHGGLT